MHSINGSYSMGQTCHVDELPMQGLFSQRLTYQRTSVIARRYVINIEAVILKQWQHKKLNSRVSKAGETETSSNDTTHMEMNMSNKNLVEATLFSSVLTVVCRSE